jgi:hypothetical protein
LSIALIVSVIILFHIDSFYNFPAYWFICPDFIFIQSLHIPPAYFSWVFKSKNIIEYKGKVVGFSSWQKSWQIGFFFTEIRLYTNKMNISL